MTRILGAVRRFIDEVFFATQFLAEDLHSEAKQRVKRPDAAPGWPATGGRGGFWYAPRFPRGARPRSRVRFV